MTSSMVIFLKMVENLVIHIKLIRQIIANFNGIIFLLYSIFPVLVPAGFALSILGSYLFFEVVDLRLKMVPVDYRDTLILLRDCTRRRFRTGMECWPRNRPVRFQETCYVTPKRLESTYVSYCDYGVNKSHTRYQSALQVCNKISNIASVINVPCTSLQLLYRSVIIRDVVE